MKTFQLIIISILLSASTNSFASTEKPEKQNGKICIEKKETRQDNDSILILGKDQFLINSEINQSINKNQKKKKQENVSYNNPKRKVKMRNA